MTDLVPDTDLAQSRPALAAYLAEASGAAGAEIVALAKLAGGTLQENWHVTVDFEGGAEAGRRDYVLRTNRPGAIPDATLTRPQEYAVMRAAFAAGVAVPEPLWSRETDSPIGRAFFVMRYAPGTASPHRLVKEPDLGGPHPALAARMGAEAARMQRVRPDAAGLDFLPLPAEGAVAATVAELRAYLDTRPEPHPIIEFGLRWLEVNAPPPGPVVLCHGDYRVGNFMVDATGLTGILDWELASWGDPLQDLGYFCAKFWRFGAADKAAGGIADRTDLYRGWAEESGQPMPTAAAMRYWEILANIRWATISIRQAERHLSGREPNLEMCLTGRVTVEMELEALRLIAEAEEEGDG